jgi:broad specificity phosphatase PhoE
MIKHYPKQLVLVRHGQSKLNVVRARSPIFFATPEERAPFIGIPDHAVGLSPVGQNEARGTGTGLRQAGFHFDRYYDSGYTRTVETLDLILGGLVTPGEKMGPRTHSILIRERETGYTYCMTIPEVETAFPWFQEYWKTLGPVFARPIGGESIADVILRVQVFLDQLFEETTGECVLIALHGRVLAAMRYLIEGWSYEQLEQFIKGSGCMNCGVTTYERNDKTNTLELREYNTAYYQKEE